MGGDGRRDQRVFPVLLGELPLFFHHLLGGLAARGGEIDERLGDHPAHPGLGEHRGDLVGEEIHVGGGRDPGEELLGNRELGAEANRLAVHVGLLRRPDVVLQPLHERQIIGEAAEQTHGEVGVGVDQTGQDEASAGVDHLAGGCVLEQILGETDGGDPAVGDGDGAVRDGFAPGLHGQDGAADDESVPV